jgi:hypothetical protein
MSTQTADYSDVIHIEPHTWGRDYAAPSSRPWNPNCGVADDDLSGHGDMTNAEFEKLLNQARSNGQVVEMRTQLGRLRMAPASTPEARAFNRKIAQAEKAEFVKVYPNGCACIRCAAKRSR